MIDREKVIQELNDSLKNLHCGFVDCVGDVYAVSEETIKNIIDLLKEQEAVKPIRDDGIYRCGNCKQVCVGYEVEFTHRIIKVENYCHKCGKAVKWAAPTAGTNNIPLKW